MFQTQTRYDRFQHPPGLVTPVEGGVASASEMPSGAVVAGPFVVDGEALTAAVARVRAKPASDE